jgi:WD40 repeat protein
MRDGIEHGPISALRFKEMAVKGEIYPDDLVRRADGYVERPTPASKIHNLIPQWHILKTSAQEGPLTHIDLRRRIDQKAITEDDLLRPSESDDWKVAASINDINELFCVIPPKVAQYREASNEVHPMTWYSLNVEKKQGPFDTGEIRRMVESGQLLSNDLVLHPETLVWMPACSIPFHDDGLFRGIFPSIVAEILVQRKLNEFDSQASILGPHAKLQGHTQKVRSLVFAHRKPLLASAGDDEAIRLWDVATGSEINWCIGHSSGVTCLAFSSSDKFLASGSYDGTVRIWNVESGEEEMRFDQHQVAVRCLSFLSRRKSLVSCDSNGTVIFWDLATKRISRQLKAGTVNAFQATSVDSRFVTATDDALCLWDLSVHPTDPVEQLPLSPLSWMTCLAISKDNLRIAVGAEEPADKRAIEPLVATIQQGCNHRDEVFGGLACGFIYAAHVEYCWSIREHWSNRWAAHWASIHAVRSLAFSPCSKMVASAGADNAVRVWDFENSELLCTFRGHTAATNCVCFSSDGKLLASAGEDRTILLWSQADLQKRFL